MVESFAGMQTTCVRTAEEEPSSVMDDCLPNRTPPAIPEPSSTDSPPTATEQSLRCSNHLTSHQISLV